MCRFARLFLMLAVLWCGLQLTVGPADAGIVTSEIGLFCAQPGHDEAGDHGHAPVGQGCHAHCPVATDLAGGPAFAAPDVARSPFFPQPRPGLRPVTLDPPIEPPTA